MCIRDSSGDVDAVLELADVWRGRSRKVKRLRVSHAFHSPCIDPMLERFGELVSGLSFAPPQMTIVSNLTGEPVSAAEICSVDYWIRHARETVRFGDGVAWLGGQRVRCFLELGPDGVLSALTHDALVGNTDAPSARSANDQQGDAEITAVPLLRAERPEAETLTRSLAEIFVHGADVDWASLFAGSGAGRIKLPTYAFQRRRYWVAPRTGSADMGSVGQSSIGHPYLGAAVELAGDRGALFTGRLSLRAHPWLCDHTVMGAVLLPGTAFVELALRVGAELGAEYVSELTLETPLVLEEPGAVLLQVSVGDPDESGGRALEIYSHSARLSGETDGEEAWTRHAIMGEPVEGGAASSGGVRLPFSFGGVGLRVSGARSLRVKLSWEAPGVLSMVAADEAGAGVAWVDSLAVREFTHEQLAGARGTLHEALFRLDWIAVPAESVMVGGEQRWALMGEPNAGLDDAIRQEGIVAESYRSPESLTAALDCGAPCPDVVLFDCAGRGLGGRETLAGERRDPTTADDEDVAGAALPDGEWLLAAAHAGVLQVLGVAQEWLADERLSDCKLVLLTQGASSAHPGES